MSGHLNVNDVLSDRLLGGNQREETAQLPVGQVQHAGTTGGQRIGAGDGLVRPHAPADHRRGREESNPHHQRMAQFRKFAVALYRQRQGPPHSPHFFRVLRFESFTDEDI